MTDDPTSSHLGQWSLFGVRLATNFPFASQLTASSGEPDLVFECGPPPALEGGLEAAEALYVSPQQIDSGEPLCALYRADRVDANTVDANTVDADTVDADKIDVLRFSGIGDFYVAPHRIVGHLVEAVDPRLVEIRFLGSVLAYWLECRGTLALHASAAVVDGQAIAFLSGNFSGKTGLVATLVRQGHSLLTDDILPIEETKNRFVGYPGYPQMRMWPDLATHFLGGCDDLEVVYPTLDKRRVKLGPDTFCDQSRPLACLYLPERRAAGESGRCEIDVVPPRDALIELVRHSFSPFLVEAIGLQPQRIDKISRLLERVPMRRVLYPEGFENLESTASAILEDVSVSV